MLHIFTQDPEIVVLHPCRPREEEIDLIKIGWEAVEEGRAAKARQARDEFQGIKEIAGDIIPEKTEGDQDNEEKPQDPEESVETTDVRENNDGEKKAEQTEEVETTNNQESSYLIFDSPLRNKVCTPSNRNDLDIKYLCWQRESFRDSEQNSYQILRSNILAQRAANANSRASQQAGIFFNFEKLHKNRLEDLTDKNHLRLVLYFALFY